MNLQEINNLRALTGDKPLNSVGVPPTNSQPSSLSSVLGLDTAPQAPITPQQEVLNTTEKTLGTTDTVQDIKQVGTDIKQSFDTRLGKIGETKTAMEEGTQGNVRSILQGAGQVAGFGADVIGAGVKGIVKGVLPQGAEDLVKSGVQKATGLATENNTVKSLLSKYEELKQSNPALARDIDSALGFADLASNFVGVGAGGKGVTTAAKLTEKAGSLAATTIKAEAPKLVNNLTSKAVDSLEQTYKDIYSGTTVGKKNLSKIQTKVASLDKAGTTGRTPMRVLAEEGIIPNRAGTKLDTFEQAQEYRNKITPLREANKMALKESGLSTAPRSLDELQAKAIQYAKTPENINSGRFNKMKKEIVAEFDLLKKNYPSGSVPLDIVDDIKSARWDNVFKNKSLVEADALRKDSEYAIAKALQKDIEEVTTKLGNPEVAQLNREIGDRLGASKFLEDLNGKTIKGGRLLKYVTTAIGASAGNTIPGKIIGAMGGNIVGELIIANNVSSPVKRMLLRNLQIKNPEAYTNTIKWLEKQNLDRETRLLLPSRPVQSVIPVGGAVNGQKVDALGKLVSPKQEPMQVVPAKKNPVTVNPSTGKFQTSYNSQSKSPTSQQIKPAITKVTNIVNTSITQPKKRFLEEVMTESGNVKPKGAKKKIK